MLKIKILKYLYKLFRNKKLLWAYIKAIDLNILKEINNIRKEV